MQSDTLLDASHTLGRMQALLCWQWQTRGCRPPCHAWIKVANSICQQSPVWTHPEAMQNMPRALPQGSQETNAHTNPLETCSLLNNKACCPHVGPHLLAPGAAATPQHHCCHTRTPPTPQCCCCPL